MSINILSDEIINQIAAGEVIENPAAVIKELFENSIDAGATEIEINLEETGFKKITIKDNGCGISKEDLLKAPLRHTTSKIKNFNDLYNINTMGFRGEALASIFSISKSKISTKTKKEKLGYEINSKKLELKESGCDVGTCVEVNELFYNTPARKKYLKSETLELKSIIDLVKRFEIIHYDKKIILKNNSKILVNKPIFKTQKKNIYYVLGKELKDNLFELDYKKQGIKIFGFIGKPSNITYSFKKNQYLFVNNRYVKSKITNNAIYEGFGSNLMVGRHPFFCIFIDIDPEIIDVNVHPTKIEIKFENELEIFEFVKNSIENVFESQTSFKDFEVKEENKNLDNSIEEIISKEKKEESKDYSSKYYTSDKQKHFEVKEDSIEYEKTPIHKEETSEEETLQKGQLYEELKNYNILGQLNKTYIIVQTPKEMLLVDQHVAEEKYYYEKFKEKQTLEKIQTQKLLSGVVINLSTSEMLLYEENKQLLNQIGFETEKFGTSEIIVRAVPINIRKEIVHTHNLKDMLHDILINKKIKCVEEEKYSKLASMACRISIMAGDELTMPQMYKMIENLRYLKQPFNCPHGRPTFLRYTYYDLDKKFKRVV